MSLPALRQLIIPAAAVSIAGTGMMINMMISDNSPYPVEQSPTTLEAGASGLSGADLKLRNTSSADLVRSYFVYKACQIPWVVDNSPTILSALTSVPIVRGLTEFAVRHTFFAQFVGGDTALDCLPVVRKLRKENIGTLFNYSVEVSEEDLLRSASSSGGGEKELYAARRKNAAATVEETIRAIVVSGAENQRYFDEVPKKLEDGEMGSTWVAVKLSGLISDPTILHRASNTILAIREQHSSASNQVYYPGTPADTEFALLAQPSPSITLPSIPDGVTNSDLSELRLLHSDLRKIMGTARQWGVRVIMDAEYSWYQPSIDALTTMLSQEYNQLPSSLRSKSLLPSSQEEDFPLVQPLIYGTYQAYLRRNPAHLTAALAHAKAHNYSLGVKICRGAYHGKESSRWTDKLGLATPTPVWALKPETDACYDSGIDVLLDAVTRDIKTKVEVPRVAVIFATHNPESVEKVVKGMRKRRLARPSKDVGGEQEELLEVGKEARKRIAIGQLYGMCDTLTNATSAVFSPNGSPLVLKYLPYGALSDVMPYLGRRAIENKTVLKGEGGAQAETERARKELMRRWFGVGMGAEKKE